MELITGAGIQINMKSCERIDVRASWWLVASIGARVLEQIIQRANDRSTSFSRIGIVCGFTRRGFFAAKKGLCALGLTKARTLMEAPVL